MPGIELTSLSTRQQQLAENARIALERGQPDYAEEAAGEILRLAPGCVAVRRLQRKAQLARFRCHATLWRRVRARLGFALLWIRHEHTPGARLAAAEKLLVLDPTLCGALKLFAEAALAQKWPETAAFAREAVRELRPHDRANLIALGEAFIGAGQPAEAMGIAGHVLREDPADGPALELLHDASIAQTVARGNWESPGSFRDKLNRA